MVIHQIGIHPRKSLLIAQNTSEPFRLMRQLQYFFEATELQQWRAQVEMKVDRALERLLRLRKPSKRLEGRAKCAHGFQISGSRHRTCTYLLIVDLRLAPDFAADRMIGQ